MTYGLEGRCSIQLSYGSISAGKNTKIHEIKISMVISFVVEINFFIALMMFTG